MDVADETITSIEIGLSQFDGTVNARFRFATVASGILPGDPPAGPIISGATVFADEGEIVCAEDAHARVLLGHGAQYKYATVIPEEKEQQGRLNRAPTLSPAPPPTVVVLPATGSGIVDKIAANIQVANDIGGDPGGPSIGFPRGTDGPRLELISNDDFSADPNTFDFDIHLPSWVSGASWDFAVAAGYFAPWDGTPMLTGDYFLQPVTANLAASLVRTRTWGVPDGGGLWVLGNLSVIGSMAPGATRRYVLSQTGSGITWNPFLIGFRFGVCVIMWDSAVGAPVPSGGPGLLTQTYPVGALRTNVLQFVVV